MNKGTTTATAGIDDRSATKSPVQATTSNVVAAKPPTVKPPAVPQSSQPAGSTETEQSSRQKVGASAPGNQGQPRAGTADTLSFAQVLVVALTKFNRDQKLELTRALAGSLGGHLTFPDARDNRARGELLQLIAAKQSLRSVPLGKPKTGVKDTGKKDKKKKGVNPAKPGSKELRSSPEQKRLADCQKAVRDKRIELGIPKNVKSDPRLQDLVSQLEAAKAAYYAVRDQVRGDDL